MGKSMNVWFKKKDKIPEVDRPIECKGYNWSPFITRGIFKAYKGQKNKSRFCINNISEKETWKDVEEWRYL